MIPFPIDIIGFILTYVVLMMMYNAILQSNSHSIGVRLFSSFLCYVLLYFLLQTVFHFLYLIYMIFIDPGAIVSFFFISVACLIAYRLYLVDPEKYMIHEMMNFVRVSLTFGNYFRLRDVDTQEKIGTHRMKKLYEEVHGKPFTDAVIATPFDEQVTTFKKVSLEELKEKKQQYPPEYFEEISQLNERKRTDVSVSFRFQLLDNTFHSLLAVMDQFEIDPAARTLSIGIMFPVEKNVPLTTQSDQSRLIERVYEALQILIAQEWFALYMPFFSIIVVTCRQKEFNEMMTETVRSLMTFRISVHHLKLRAARITTISELMRIADISFL